MLDALSDFWKPLKKTPAAQEKLRPEQLQIGSAIGFGFVPQTSLSGRRLEVAAINTYRFGEETLTSFVLTQEKDAGVSMIVAESEGEQYLAISRRLTINDRMKMFNSQDLENATEKSEAAPLACNAAPADFKGWTVASYKREIQGLTGHIYQGDFRKIPLPSASAAQEFKYTLLVSESNEHAIEIEKYTDGRTEVYATVYRRISDIGEVSPPARMDQLNRPDLKLASKAEEKPAEKPAVMAGPEDKPAPVKLQELSHKAVVAPATPQPIKPAPVIVPEAKKTEEKPKMQPTSAMKNGSAPAQAVTPAQEIKAVSKPTMNGMENEAVECELRVANKIIDEAIRNEMRLSDVVRRIIELPVAHQEAVHIPITLSDDDYALLAIRYGIAASDRAAIKRRIIEDLNDFSGNGKKAA